MSASRLITAISILILITIGANAQPLADRFEGYRFQTIGVLQLHKQYHPDCLLNTIDIDLVKTIEFRLVDMKNDYMVAVAWAKKNPPYIEFNSNRKWPAEETILIIIHELLHITKLCGDDAPIRDNPQIACTLWNKKIHNTYQLSTALKAHLRKEIKRVKSFKLNNSEEIHIAVKAK